MYVHALLALTRGLVYCLGVGPSYLSWSKHGRQGPNIEIRFFGKGNLREALCILLSSKDIHRSRGRMITELTRKDPRL